MNRSFKRGSGAQVFRKAGAVSLAVKLPYSCSSEESDDGNLFEAVFALPEPGVSFADALAALQGRGGEEKKGEDGGNSEQQEGRWQEPPRAGVDVSVPAFKVEGSCLRLSPHLRSNSSPSSLSLCAPFSQATCEFTRMFAEGKTAPAIEEVLHKVCVECDEEGSEAAAATAVVMTRCMLAVEEPLRFRADRPFLFAVRHARSGLDLFVGRVAVPRTWLGGGGGGGGGGGRENEGDGEPGVRAGGAPVVA